MNCSQAALPVFLMWSACSNVSKSDPASAQRQVKRTPSTLSNIRYFGYWGSGLNGLIDSSPLTAGYSNVAHIRDVAGTAEMASKLNAARRDGQLVVLHVQNVFFPWLSSHLVADPESDFRTFAAQVAPWNDIILGAYLFDEPFWNNSTTPGWSSVEPLALASHLETAAHIIHRVWPGKPVLLSYAFPELTSELQLTPSVDWFAVNCYAAYQSGGNCSEEHTFNVQEWLRSRLAEGQRLFLTSDAFWNSSPTPAIESALVDRARFLSNYSQQHSEVVALMPFVYQTTPTENLWGASSMPTVAAYYAQLGRSILGLPCTPDGTTTTACEHPDFVRRDSCGGEIERWRDAPPPYCP
jgi:hypothetical protein